MWTDLFVNTSAIEEAYVLVSMIPCGARLQYARLHLVHKALDTFSGEASAFW